MTTTIQEGPVGSFTVGKRNYLYPSQFPANTSETNVTLSLRHALLMEIALLLTLEFRMVLLRSNINLARRLMIRAFLRVPCQDQRFGVYLHAELALRTKISSVDLNICIQVGLRGNEEYIFTRGGGGRRIRPLHPDL